MSSRLPTRWSRRSAPSSMPASSSASSSSDQATSSERSEETAALMPASGVRRSWLTAASSAVRMRLPSASSRACSASSGQPLAVQDDGGLGGEGGQHPAVLGGQHPAGQGERHVVADRHVDVGVLGAVDRAAGPTLPAQVHGVDVARRAPAGPPTPCRRSRGPAPAARPGWSRRAARCRRGRRGSRTRRAAGRPGGCGGRPGPRRRRPTTADRRRRSRWRRCSSGRRW